MCIDKKMIEIIQAFIHEVSLNNTEVYNEFSLQHELGVYIRSQLPDYKVQFERNVSFFDFNKNNFIKKEIDISIFSPDKSSLLYAIELKYPRNGQYPEQMYSFCKDISFIEQLHKAGFQKTFLLILADDSLFYEGSGNGIYGYFRHGITLSGEIRKPTGKKIDKLFVDGSYNVKWDGIRNKLKYTLIESNNSI